MATVSALVSSVAGALAPIAGVRAAYLFGSRALGKARPESDLDLAVAFDRELDTAGREAARRDILDALYETAGTTDMFVDVVDLRRTDSSIAFRAVQQGVLVMARTPEDRVATEVFVSRSYDDDAYKRRLFENAARRVAAGWANGG